MPTDDRRQSDVLYQQSRCPAFPQYAIFVATTLKPFSITPRLFVKAAAKT
jgi:hypothetical protein